MLDHIFHGRTFKRQVLLAPGPVVERMSSDIHHVRDPAVVKALAYIRDHAFRGLNVDDLAPHSGVCRRVLERKFRRLLGLSPHEQIHHVQIEEAKRLLSMTDAMVRYTVVWEGASAKGLPIPIAEFQIAKTSRSPLSTSAIVDGSTFLTFSVRHCLSTVITCETLTTESLASPACRALSKTFPGA
jgi:AraC-like DNA-binding protein